MLLSKNVDNLIIFDIETANGYSSLDELDKDNPKLAELWSKRCEWLRIKYKENEDLTDEQLYLTKAGLQAEFGKIICISVGQLKDKGKAISIKSYYSDDERQLLKEFATLINTIDVKLPAAKYVGHNVTRFDIPYICKRLLINKIAVPNSFKVHNQKPWEVPFLDTSQIWSAGAWQESYTSLDLLSTVLGIDSPKSDINGSEVSQLYYNGELNRIKKYCEQDVIATANVILAFAGLNKVENIDIK